MTEPTNESQSSLLVRHRVALLIGSLLLAAIPFLLAWGGTRYRPGVPAEA